MHGALINFRRQTPAKRHPIPSASPKCCIERGFVTRLNVKTFAPETIFGIYNGELICLWKAGRDFLHLQHLLTLSTDGSFQNAKVKAYAKRFGFDKDKQRLLTTWPESRSHVVSSCCRAKCELDMKSFVVASARTSEISLSSQLVMVSEVLL